MSRWGIGGVACVVLCLASSVKADEDPVRVKLDKARSTFTAFTKKHQGTVAEWLDKREEVARLKGDKITVDQVKADRQEFQEKGEIPKTAPAAFKSQLTSARSNLMNAFTTAVREYTRSGNDEAAEAVEKELEDFKDSGEVRRVLRSDNKVVINARSEEGYPVGKVSRRDMLVMQYLSGKWKAWGKYATESPDGTSPEGGTDACRLAICEIDGTGKATLLSVVPAGTASKPFEWVAAKDIEKVVLRINDQDGNFKSNPDAGVTYRLRFLQAK